MPTTTNGCSGVTLHTHGQIRGVSGASPQHDPGAATGAPGPRRHRARGRSALPGARDARGGRGGPGEGHRRRQDVGERLEPIVGRVVDVPTEAAARVAADLLSRHPRPDAIYATLDRMAVGALIACRSAGLSVPEDLAVAAITDTYVLRSADPPVTALDLNAPRIGREAVELLVGLVEGEEPSRAVTVPSRLVKRTSTQGTGPTTTGPKSARVKAFEQRPMSSQERPPA